jgi:hypothetical protein
VGIEKAIAALALGAALVQGAYAQEPKPTYVFSLPKAAPYFSLPRTKNIDLTAGSRYEKTLDFLNSPFVKKTYRFFQDHRIRQKDQFVNRSGVNLFQFKHYDFSAYKQSEPKQILRPRNFEPGMGWRSNARLQLRLGVRF